MVVAADRAAAVELVAAAAVAAEAAVVAVVVAEAEAADGATAAVAADRLPLRGVVHRASPAGRRIQYAPVHAHQ